ncbi:MAG: hypothetical protein ACHQIM_06275, partial [Sphingobacteriales bacterium]
AILIHKKFIKNGGELQVFLINIKLLKDQISIAYEGITSLKNAIITVPPLTIKIFKAKHETVLVMTKISDEFLSYVNITENMINMIEDGL